MSVPSDFELYRPDHTYGDEQLPLPLPRLRSMGQAENDRIFGYPPTAGQRNAPPTPVFQFVPEDVGEIATSIQLREEAQARGIDVDRSTNPSKIYSMIEKHESGQPPLKLRFTNDLTTDQPSVQEPTPETTRKRRRVNPPAENTGQEGEQVTKRRRANTPAKPEQAKHPPKRRGRAASTEKEKAKPRGRRAKTPAQATMKDDEPTPKNGDKTATDSTEQEAQKKSGANTAVEPKLGAEPTRKRRRANQSANATEVDEQPRKRRRTATPAAPAAPVAPTEKGKEKPPRKRRGKSPETTKQNEEQPPKESKKQPKRRRANGPAAAKKVEEQPLQDQPLQVQPLHVQPLHVQPQQEQPQPKEKLQEETQTTEAAAPAEEAPVPQQRIRLFLKKREKPGGETSKQRDLS